MSKLTEMNEQYGNSGYNQIDGYGANPYDQRNDGAQGGRYNNYSQGQYDDRTFDSHPLVLMTPLTTP